MSQPLASPQARPLFDPLSPELIANPYPFYDRLLGAANRDPAVYPEPDRLDITRANIRPLSFGGGIHFCLGAQLARIEAEIAIATLLRRLPNLALDDPEHPDWRQTFVLRGLMELPASW